MEANEGDALKAIAQCRLSIARVFQHLFVRAGIILTRHIYAIAHLQDVLRKRTLFRRSFNTETNDSMKAFEKLEGCLRPSESTSDGDRLSSSNLFLSP